MEAANVQGQPLEVTVIACKGLKDTEWLSKQDPYVCIEYGSTKYRTRTCTDGGKNPTFQEKFMFPLIHGVNEMNLVVWNSNTITGDDFIGSGKVRLTKAITQGYDDNPWPLWTRSGKHAGEVNIILRCANNTGMTSPAYEHGPAVSYPSSDPPPYHPPAGYGGYPPQPPPSGYPQPSAYAPPPGPQPYGAPHPAPGPYPYGAPPNQHPYGPPPGAHPYGAPPGPPSYGYGAPQHGHGTNSLNNWVPSAATSLMNKMIKMKMKL
ncbi:protein SRC2 homolog isoform X1 [Citrus clementina]|nr:protein SRC2 homolog isoform X1 [Citrus x clementina]